MRVRARARICVRVRACVRLASDSWETIKVIIINLGTVTASDMRMYHGIIILTLTFIQGHTYLNRETSKSSIISTLIFVLSNPHHVCCEDNSTTPVSAQTTQIHGV